MSKAWTDEETAKLIALREQDCLRWSAVGMVLGRRPTSCWDRYQRVRGWQSKRDCTFEIPSDVLADRDRRREMIRDPIAELLGDPAPGYSALDRGCGHTGHQRQRITLATAGGRSSLLQCRDDG